MKKLKSTLESFKENELLAVHKLKVKGGLPVDGVPPQELPEEPIDDEDGDPLNGPGPRGGGGTSSVATGSTKLNP